MEGSFCEDDCDYFLVRLNSKRLKGNIITVLQKFEINISINTLEYDRNTNLNQMNCRNIFCASVVGNAYKKHYY